MKTMSKPENKDQHITVQFSKDEFEAFTNFLNVTSKVYERLALDAATHKDEKSFSVFEARWKLANALAHKLNAYYYVGEPTSKNLH